MNRETLHFQGLLKSGGTLPTCQCRMMLHSSPNVSLWFPSTMSVPPIFTKSTCHDKIIKITNTTPRTMSPQTSRVSDLVHLYSNTNGDRSFMSGIGSMKTQMCVSYTADQWEHQKGHMAYPALTEKVQNVYHEETFPSVGWWSHIQQPAGFIINSTHSIREPQVLLTLFWCKTCSTRLTLFKACTLVEPRSFGWKIKHKSK